MIIGVTGDTHNNLKNIKTICSIFNENTTDLVFHTGDISLAKSLLAFKDLKCPLIAILGNNDIEERQSLSVAAESFDCKIFEEPHFKKIKNKSFSILHHPELIDEEMISKCDYIIHGHTHRYRLDVVNKCTIFNPGECAGFMKGKNKIGIINLNKFETKVVNF